MTVSRSSATVTERIKEAVETALKACADGRAPAILAAAFNDESDRYNASRSPLNQLIAGGKWHRGCSNSWSVEGCWPTRQSWIKSILYFRSSAWRCRYWISRFYKAGIRC